MREAHDAQLVHGATGLLGELNRAEVLAAADVHVARRVGALAGESDDAVLLALALAVRGVRLGSSCVDLRAAVDELVREAPQVEWPGDDWWARVAASPLSQGDDRVLVVEEPLLHLARYHHLEHSLCRRLAARLEADPPAVDEARLDADLDRLFAGDSFAEQREAARRAATGWTSVVTGGPGTGKTTTIARLLAALSAQHTAQPTAQRPLTVGLAAPTGKAAARMREAIAGAAAADVFTDDERTWLTSLDAVTLHRLLGPRPDHRTAFRHHAGQKLGHDVVVVDETSMVSLLMMERLVQAVSPTCRLVLVGDAEQLASVEAGAVLRDVIDGLADADTSAVTRLTSGHRFHGVIGDLAAAIVAGDADRTLDLLESDDPAVRFVDPDELDAVVADRPRSQARAVARAAADGDVEAGLAALAEHRMLCAHRDGPWGVRTWNERLEREVRTFPDPARPWFAGRPVLLTRNDASLGVHNGDVGVTLDEDGRLVVRLDTGRDVSAARIAFAQSAYASTVHRSQGSEFEHVTLLLPEQDSAVLTRELLYTAVTRTRSTLTVVGTPDVVRQAVERRTARASGVARRLAGLLTRD
ncbi:exodeoxyribonuclease V subunit alpha [Aeromicrobium sp. CTD01-1L150]|uniref:exodeoxyribonuclease V subunit alpha n=1 Tax=Aeromicrobium sp. CTD01-1L150 TaxID=3341830 RepID=UPI0035C1946D